MACIDPLTPLPAGWLQTLRTVAWSFFGVRKASDHERDLARLRPAQVVAMGLVLALAFIVALVLVVGWVVSSGVAR